jgi:hypothetical protein
MQINIRIKNLLHGADGAKWGDNQAVSLQKLETALLCVADGEPCVGADPVAEHLDLSST